MTEPQAVPSGTYDVGRGNCSDSALREAVVPVNSEGADLGLPSETVRAGIRLLAQYTKTSRHRSDRGTWRCNVPSVDRVELDAGPQNMVAPPLPCGRPAGGSGRRASGAGQRRKFTLRAEVEATHRRGILACCRLLCCPSSAWSSGRW